MRGFALFLLPAFEVQVFPEHKSESGSNDVIGCAADEFRVVVERQSDRFFQSKFKGHGLRQFLDDGHGGSPFGTSFGIERSFFFADKTPGTESVPSGGSDPTNLLGG